MKKRAIFIFLLATAIFSMFTLNTYAAALTTISVSQSATEVKPGEEITLTVNFGTKLGSYTFDFNYDKNALEFVSASGGESNDNGSRIRVYYFDQTTDQSAPRESMTIKFKAKSTITTQTATNISITAEGLANPDASVEYDDITTAIVKNITIKPYESAIVPQEDGDNKGATEKPSSNTSDNTNTSKTSTNTTNTTKTASAPKKLPATGENLYAVCGVILAILIAAYIFVSKKK